MAGFGILPPTNPVSQWIDPRRSALLGLGAGFLAGNPAAAAQGAMQGMQYDQQRAENTAEQQKQVEQYNATKEWLKARGREDLIPLVDAGQGGFALQQATAQATDNLTANQRDFMFAQENPAYADFLGKTGQSSTPASIQEWQAFSTMTPEQKSQYLTMKRASPWLNAGTQFVQPNQANPNDINAAVPIDNAGKARDTAIGGAQGTAEGAYTSLKSKLPGLRSVVKELGDLANTATYTAIGRATDEANRQLGLPPSEQAIAAAKYMAMVNNQILPLLRDTFGAQFTEREGATLRATLGDPTMSPKEKQAVLEAFIAQKERDVEALARQSGGDGSQPTSAGNIVDYTTYFGGQ